MLPVILLLGVTGCASPTSSIPPQKLTLMVENYVAQQGIGDTATESSSAVFCVKAASDVGADALAEIRNMSVEWPGGSQWTPVNSGSNATFEPPAVCTWQPEVLLLTGAATIDRLVAYVQVPQVVLTVGTYTLHVTFGDGQEVQTNVVYDGQTVGPPTAVTVYPTTLGVGISWNAPAAELSWGLEVKSADEGTTLGSGIPLFAHGGYTSGWVKTDLARGTSYVLGLFIFSSFNSRYVTIPFTVPS